MRRAPWPLSWPGRLALLLAAVTALRVWFAVSVDLCPDEAYYWTWSLVPDWGYYDHGPVVAWLMWLGTALLGTGELGVRLGALVASLITAVFVYRLAAATSGRQSTAFWTVVLLETSPLFATGAVIHTPDAALAAAWSAAAWYGLSALERRSIWPWLGMGLAVGVAIMAKATGFLFLVGLGVFLVACPAGRRRLFTPGPVSAVLVALLVATPHIVWNARTSGGSFSFQLQHLAGGWRFRPRGLLELLGGQAGVLGPLTFLGLVVFAVVGAGRRVRRSKSDVFLLWCLAVPLLVLCLLLSLLSKVEANWPAVAYLTLLPGAAWSWRGGHFYPRRGKIWLALAVALALATTIVAHLQALHPFLPLEQRHDPTRRLRGWAELARTAERQADAQRARLAAEGYGPVSELRFYTGREVAYQPSRTRRSQYDLWPAGQTSGHDILFLQPRGSQEVPRLCKSHDDRWLIEGLEKSSAGRREGDFNWWVCKKTRNR